MDEKGKKVLVICITIIALSIAGFVFYKNVFAVDNVSSNDKSAALYCENCGGFEVSLKEYREVLSSNPDIAVAGPQMKLKCPKCGERTCYFAIKCYKCNSIYPVNRRNSDQCPECGYIKED